MLEWIFFWWLYGAVITAIILGPTYWMIENLRASMITMLWFVWWPLRIIDEIRSRLGG